MVSSIKCILFLKLSDDWLSFTRHQCFFADKGIFFFADISAQDSTLLSDIVEVGRLPCFKREEDDIHYAFYILTRHGLRYECSSNSMIQVCSS